MDRNAAWALIRFIGSIRVRKIRVNGLDLGLRWHTSHSAELNENVNLGYSQDQDYS